VNTQEDCVLHGLYFATEMVDQDMIVTGPQILWLLRHSISEGSNWRGDDGKQRAELSRIARLRFFTPEEERPLRYLAARGFINHELPKADMEMIHVSVTVLGADRARKLHTFWGRCGLCYSDHKDGVAGLLAAALVSLVVSLLVSWLTKK
jgi:hypothetical protein